MTETMTLDYVLECYNIRELDNRFQVRITIRPGINCYVSLQRLNERREWEHIPK